MSESIEEPAGEASSPPSNPPRIVGPDGLTNKERRLAKQAEKRKRAEEEAEAAKAKAAASEATKGEGKKGRNAKRKKEEDTRSTVAGSSEAQDASQTGEENGEAEALSHKEQRKRRRLEKKGLLPPTGAAGSTDFDGGDKREALPERSQYAIWIGNLSFMTNAQRLQSWLEEKGLQGISRVHMPRGVKKFEQNRGFAYVDLPTAEAVEAGVALSEDHLEGRRLLIKSASDYTGRPALNPAMAALAQASSATTGLSDGATPAEDQSNGAAVSMPGGGGKTGLTKTAQKILRSQKHPAGPTLFVGNLSFNSTQEGLHDLFERSAKAREGWAKSVKERKREEKKEQRLADFLAAKKRRAERDAAVEKEKKSREDSNDSDSDSSDEEGDGANASSSSSSESSSSSSSSSSDEEEEEEDGTEATPRGAGIRKVRMGTFEDTGKCKGFAFVDFHSPVYSTASLIDPRNYRLDGRELTLEFAGSDAVRRGAPKGQHAGGASSGKGKWPSSKESLAHKPGEKRPHRVGPRGLRHKERAAKEAAAVASGEVDPSNMAVTSTNPNHKENQAERRARREKEGGSKGSYTKRAKPGAALANAQRGKTGIVTSGEAGQKTTFE